MQALRQHDASQRLRLGIVITPDNNQRRTSGAWNSHLFDNARFPELPGPAAFTDSGYRCKPGIRLILSKIKLKLYIPLLYSHSILLSEFTGI